MWRRRMSVFGLALVAVALAALPADSVLVSYLGGSTRRGYIEDGRYFVEYKGDYTEVSASAWRLQQWLEWAPPTVWILGLAGMLLIAAGKPRTRQPAPVMPVEPPIREYLAGAGIVMGFIAAGAWLGWFVSGAWPGAMRLAGGATWAVHLGGWYGCYAGVTLALLLVTRRLRKQAHGDSGTAPDSVRNSVSGDSQLTS